MIRKTLYYITEKYKKHKKIILNVLLILFIGLFILYFFDIYLNSIIAEWFSKKFLTQEIVNSSLLNKEVMNNIFKWGLFKKYCIFFAFLVICLFVIGNQLLLKRHEKKIRNQERAHLEDLIGLITKDEPFENMPIEYRTIVEKVKALLDKQEKSNCDKVNETEHVSNMITYLAHDLRTPLTSIIGYLTLFLDAPEMPLDVRNDYLKKTLNKAKHLENLVDDFFEISKYSSKKMVLNKQQINLSYMFVQLADEFFPILERKKLKVDIHVSKDLTANVDPEKMGRVFSNLLKNAYNYSFDHTTIRIFAEAKAEGIEIYFINKGKLIPEWQQEHVFNHFIRLDESRNSDSGGSGLGLAIVKAIVNQHGGDITLLTQNEENVFKIILPK